MQHLNRITSLLLLFVLCGCGTLEVGIEDTPTIDPGAAGASASPAAPAIGLSATSPAQAPPSGLTATSTRLPPTWTVVPSLAFTPVPTSLPSPSATPTPAPTRIKFLSGNVAYDFGTNLAPGVAQRYVLELQAGQRMTVTTKGDVTVTVQDPDGNVVPSLPGSSDQWQGVRLRKGDYTVTFLGRGEVHVTIRIPPPGS